MEIIWSIKAEKEYSKNIEYLISIWGVRSAEKYNARVSAVIQLLKGNPQLGRFDQTLQLYKILVVKQIYLFYEIRKSELYLISFWNNYQRPYW